MISNKSHPIIEKYFEFIKKHVNDVISGNELEFFEINKIANSLNISHAHLTETIQNSTGHHPCYYYDVEIIAHAKLLLHENEKSIAQVAKILTYDPSNFSKFFKKFTGLTPGAYRKSLLSNR